MLSITTDYTDYRGNPGKYLKNISEAGFTHILWCHHWNDDFIYDEPEIRHLVKLFGDFGLKLNDLHASAGIEKSWGSLTEYERLAGVSLVKNRMDMAEKFSCDTIVMHVPPAPETPAENKLFWEGMFRSLDSLRPYASARGIRIAIENSMESVKFDSIEKILSSYGPEFTGLCYDAGHGNIHGNGLDCLDKLKDRLLAIHIHDNDGSSDQHKLPFTGTVDWERLSGLIARSSYGKCVNLEVLLKNSGIADEGPFLKAAYDSGMRLSEMIRARTPKITA